MSDNNFTPDEATNDEGQAHVQDTPAPLQQPADVGHVSTSPVAEPPASADDQLSVLREATANLRALNLRIEELEKEKAARDRADEAARSEVWVHPNTHVLVLSNGETVETANPSVTHHSTEDGIWPVVARHTLIPE